MGKAKNIHAIMHFRFVSIHLSWVDILQSTNQMQTHSKTTKKTEKGLVGRKNYHYHFAIAFLAYYSTVLMISVEFIAPHVHLCVARSTNLSSYALNCSHLRAVSRMKYTENLLVVT